MGLPHICVLVMQQVLGLQCPSLLHPMFAHIAKKTEARKGREIISVGHMSAADGNRSVIDFLSVHIARLH